MKAINALDSKAKSKRRYVKASKYFARPRRPLTSYNIFFANERKKIIREQQRGQEQWGEDQTAGSLKISTAGRGRAHVGFAGLAHYVSQKWKTVCKSYKMELEELARLDKMRYDKEMKDWRSKLKFDEDLGQRDTQDEVSSKFDDSCMKIEEENKKNHVQKTEATQDGGRALSFLAVFPKGNQKVLSRGMESVPADIKESFTYTHRESLKCLVKSDYEPLPFKPHSVSCNTVPRMNKMDSTVFSQSLFNIQYDDPSAYICHPCNDTTDWSTHVLPSLSYNAGQVEIDSFSTSFQFGRAPWNALGNQEHAKFTELNVPMSYVPVRTVPLVTAISSRSAGAIGNTWDHGSSVDANFRCFNDSDDYEQSLRDYSLQDIQRFFGIEPEPQEK